jgi:hypothetical protein
LLPAAFAFQMFADVSWGDIAKAGVALVGLGIAGAAFGSFLPLMLAGAAAIGALGLALIPFGAALNLMAPVLEKFTPILEAFGNIVTKVFSGIATVVTAASNGVSTIFGSLQNVDVAKLLTIGPALVGIGVGLAALGGGNVLAAISSFFAGDPVKKLERLAATSDGIVKVATALQSMATSLTQVSTALSNIDISKLDELDEFASNRSKESVVKGITDFITTPIKAIGEAIGGGAKKEEAINASIDLTPLVSAIKEVKASVDKLYTKETAINMDGKKVGTTLVQSSYKLA